MLQTIQDNIHPPAFSSICISVLLQLLNLKIYYISSSSWCCCSGIGKVTLCLKKRLTSVQMLLMMTAHISTLSFLIHSSCLLILTDSSSLNSDAYFPFCSRKPNISYCAVFCMELCKWKHIISTTKVVFSHLNIRNISDTGSWYHRVTQGWILTNSFTCHAWFYSKLLFLFSCVFNFP